MSDKPPINDPKRNQWELDKAVEETEQVIQNRDRRRSRFEELFENAASLIADRLSETVREVISGPVAQDDIAPSLDVPNVDEELQADAFESDSPVFDDGSFEFRTDTIDQDLQALDGKTWVQDWIAGQDANDLSDSITDQIELAQGEIIPAGQQVDLDLPSATEISQPVDDKVLRPQLPFGLTPTERDQSATADMQQRSEMADLPGDIGWDESKEPFVGPADVQPGDWNPQIAIALADAGDVQSDFADELLLYLSKLHDKFNEVADAVRRLSNDLDRAGDDR